MQLGKSAMALPTWLLKISEDGCSNTSLNNFFHHHLNGELKKKAKKKRKGKNKKKKAELQASIETFIETIPKCSDFIPNIYGHLKNIIIKISK